MLVTWVCGISVFFLSPVILQGLDMFGRKVGFLKFKADVVDNETGQKVVNQFSHIPCLVFP